MTYQTLPLTTTLRDRHELLQLVVNFLYQLIWKNSAPNIQMRLSMIQPKMPPSRLTIFERSKFLTCITIP